MIFQLTHAINWYVKFGYNIESGKNIELAIKDTAGVHVVNLGPNHDKGK